MTFFAIGEIVKTRGLRGCIKVLCYEETKNTFTEIKSVFIEVGSGRKNRFAIRKIDLSGKVLFLELEGIPDVKSAQALVGRKIFLPEDMKEKLPEGEYYCRDIIGIDVYSEDDKYIGKIETVFSTRSNDVYVCRGGGREILLPAIADVIRKIDINNRVMIIRFLEGL